MIYILPLLILICCSIKYSNKSIYNRDYNKWLWIITCLFIAIAAFRFEIGADTTYSYMPKYIKYPSIDKLTAADFEMTDYQPGWVVFCSLCKYISPSFYTFQFIHALILNISILFFLKRNSNNVFVALLVYYIMNYLEYNTECLRESMAISCSLIAFEFYKGKKYLFTTLFAFLAFNFHVSAIGALLIPIIFRIKFTKKSFFVVLVLSLTSPFIYQMLPDQTKLLISITGNQDLADYYNNQFSRTLNANYYIMHVVYYVFIPMYLAYYNIKHSDGKYIGFAYTFSILQMLAIFSYAFYRLSNYIAPFYWLMIADCARSLLHSKYQGSRNSIFVIYVFIGLYVCQGGLLGNDSDKRIFLHKKLYERYFPYKSWIFNDNQL